MKIVSISGGEGAGKDHVANMVAQSLSQRGIKTQRFSFAARLYEEISVAFEMTLQELQNRATKEIPNEALALVHCPDQNFKKVALQSLPQLRGTSSINEQTPLSPREVLQLWGTDYRRNSEFGCQSYWEDQVLDQFQQNPDTQVWVGSDTRMGTEVERLRGRGAILIRLNADWQNNEDEHFINKGHASKWEWRLARFDKTVVNKEGKPESAYREILDTLNDLKTEKERDRSQEKKSSAIAMRF